jgi:ribonuclease VapC
VIVVDTSALIAIVDSEPGSELCSVALSAQSEVIVSAGTLAEAMIVASGRNMERALEELVDDLELIIDPVTVEVALQVGHAYRQWGKGFHPAKLNFGDCFAYVTAAAWQCPLLFIGDDFSKTDIKSVL